MKKSVCVFFFLFPFRFGWFIRLQLNCVQWRTECYSNFGVIGWKSSGIRIKTIKNCNTITRIHFVASKPLSHAHTHFAIFLFHSVYLDFSLRDNRLIFFIQSNSHYHTRFFLSLYFVCLSSSLRFLLVCVHFIRIFNRIEIKQRFSTNNIHVEDVFFCRMF